MAYIVMAQARPVTRIYSYGLRSCALLAYGLHSYGLFSYGTGQACGEAAEHDCEAELLGRHRAQRRDTVAADAHQRAGRRRRLRPTRAETRPQRAEHCKERQQEREPADGARCRRDEAGTAAVVRVVIESSDDEDVWGTIGVSENVIEASWIALVDSIEYKLYKDEARAQQSQLAPTATS